MLVHNDSRITRPLVNRESLNIPITALANIHNLANLLHELPLPTPLPRIFSQNLLSHLQNSNEGCQLLNTHESILITPLIEALSCINTDHIVLKDNYFDDQVSCTSHTVPQTVQYLLSKNPGLFVGLSSLPKIETSDQLVAPDQGLLYSNISENLEQHAFDASAISPCEPHQIQNTYNFILEHSQLIQNEDISENKEFNVQSQLNQNKDISENKEFNVQSQLIQNEDISENKEFNVQSKSPILSSFASSGEQSSDQHPVSSCLNVILNETEGSLISKLERSTEILNSLLVSQNVLQPSIVDNQSSNNSDEDKADMNSVNTEQNNETKNHSLNSKQSVHNTASNCSPLILYLNKPCENTKSLSTSIEKNNLSNAKYAIKENISSIPVSSSESVAQQFEPYNENNIVDQMEKNINKTTFKPIVKTSPRKKVFASEPLVILTKLSLEDLLLAQKSVERFTIKNQKSCSLPEIGKLAIQNEDHDASGFYKSLSQVPGPSNSSTLHKSNNEEYFTKGKKSDLLEQKGLKRSVKSSTEKEKDKSSTSPEPTRKRFMKSTNKSEACKTKIFLQSSSPVTGPSITSTPNIIHCEEYFTNDKTSEVLQNKGIKRSLKTFPEQRKRSNTSSPIKQTRKKQCISSNIIVPSLNSEDESDEFYGKESPTKPVTPSKKKTKKKSKRESAIELLSIEDLMDSNTYQNFSRIVDDIFDAVEEVDLSLIIDEDTECAAEILIPLDQLQTLGNEAAKLKKFHCMNQFPPEKLVKLLAILERNIVDGTKLLPVQIIEDQEEEEKRLWLELTMERVMRSVDASLTALYIMTSPKMPQKVFFEDIIEKIVLFLKFQLQNTIFPAFDPAYRLDPKSKDGYAGSIKQKRAHVHKVKEKCIIQLYNKLQEAIGLFAELLELQTLTDTIILQVSTLGITPFFVEGISELQLNALRLVTTVFAQYDKHRELILEDILASIARLPTSKRSLRSYRLNSEEHIQMLTALILQLIHCVVRLPEPEDDLKSDFSSKENVPKNQENNEIVCIDKDILIITSYEACVKTAVSFLSVFLRKCATKNEDIDYRPLFENFVQDLLCTVNKPQWPSSELLLSILGRLLVRNFTNKSVEMTLRVASLDYLGVVAARLRKDAIMSEDHKNMIDDIIKRILTDTDDNNKSPSKRKKDKNAPMKQDESQILQKALLQYLESNESNDPAFQFSRKFYIAQWYRDAAYEIRQSDKYFNFPEKEIENSVSLVSLPCKNNQPRTSRRKSSQINSKENVLDKKSEKESTLQNEEVNTKDLTQSNQYKTNCKKSSQITYVPKDIEKKNDELSQFENDEVNATILALTEKRKEFLLTMTKENNFYKVNKNKEHIDYKTAELISQHLSSSRYFSKSFDLYLSQILCVLGETAVAVRTKAMKCLTLVIEADPSILARPDVQKGVHARLLDLSTSVREAAVDLLGKYILICPELISQYYEMLTDRLRDTGVSVRKRVIKILKEICLELPDFPKKPEICVHIIRRVNDEDGIKKLVGEVFVNMWFSSVSHEKQERVLQEVRNITHVVEACRETGLEWFEQLLTNLLKNKDDSHYKSVVKSCKQIVECLVENLLQLEESSQNVDGSASSHLVSCLATLHLFSKIHPSFVVPYATTIQPYLSMKCNTRSDFLVIKNVVQTLELIVPLIEHPSDSFLVQIEEDIVKVIFRHHMGLLQSCVSCLGSVVTKVTHNYQLVKDCFQKFFQIVLLGKRESEKNSQSKMLDNLKPKLLRSLYTLGLFCRHFSFDKIDVASPLLEQISLKDRVFESIIYFNQHNDENIRLKALTGLGFMMIRHYDFMLGPEIKTLYHNLLTSPIASSILKCQVLKNIANYLVAEEIRMIQKDAEWSKTSKSEDLKEMCDVSSGMASTVIQVYLNQILQCIFHTNVDVRKACLSVIELILGQGLVHPVQIVPYLVCFGSEDNPIIRTKAEQFLKEIEKKYPGFIQMKAVIGVRMSFKMQQIIQNPNEILRGFRSPDTPVSRSGFLYSLMRSTRQNRRAFLCSLLKLFDEQAQTPLTELLYIADNIAYFPYMALDEPLFVIYQVDIMLSVCGSNLLQTFHEALFSRPSSEVKDQIPLNSEEDFDDHDDDLAFILENFPEDTRILQECIVASQGCILLLYVKQTLKEMYGITDNKILQYSPNETAKVFEKSLNRKDHIRFDPDSVLRFMKYEDCQIDDQGKENLVNQYFHFKQLMLTIDSSKDDDDEDNQSASVQNSIAETVLNESRGESKLTQSPMNKAKTVIPSKSKSPSSSRPLKKSPRTTKKIIKKTKKKRKRLLDSESEDW